jgi:hypothetical protein
MVDNRHARGLLMNVMAGGTYWPTWQRVRVLDGSVMGNVMAVIQMAHGTRFLIPVKAEGT